MHNTFKTHQCDDLPKNGVYITFADEESVWTLTIQKEATESDLEENHYLDIIGDIIWATELEIKCCPFCGEKLPGLENGKNEAYGKFRHIDSSGWTSKIQ